MATDQTASTAGREFINTRLLNAPREQVYKAFSDPTILARWWGPQGFTNTIQQFDLRVGGSWIVVMHGPNGTDYPNESEFVEVVPQERIVVHHLRPMHSFLLTMTFAEEAGQTRVAWHMQFDSREEADRLRAFIPTANEENLDRLEAVLNSMT